MISLRLAFVFLTITFVSAQLSCIQVTNCTDCKQTSGCGYCDIPGGVGICFPSVSETLCTTVGGRWNPNTCSAPAVSACLVRTDCNSCINQTGCGWCNLGDVGVCHDSNQTCNALSGSFFLDRCPTGTNCGNYSTCQQCQSDRNCMSCQITPTTFTCVSAGQVNLFCPDAFYRQNASCNVSTQALTCGSRSTCTQCGGQVNATSSQFNNATILNNGTQSTNANISCGWCNFGTTQGGECFATQDLSFCKNLGVWNQPCPQPSTPSSTCTNVSDLHFCTGRLLGSNVTDMPWVLKLTDSYLNTRWSDIGSSVHKEVNGAGIGFCDDCWNAYKHFLCAAAEPQCGMAACYQNAISSATDCIAACPCDTMDQFVVQPTCFKCVMGCTSAAVAPSCGQFGLSKRTCIQLVNICGCNPQAQDANTICSDFSDQGFFVDLGNGSCTDTPTWCGLSSGNQTANFTSVTNINASSVSPNMNNSAIPALNNSALMKPTRGQLCPNSHVCLSIYNALGADVVANPVTTLGGVDNNGNPGTNGNGTNGSGAVSTCASPLLLLAALFLVLFV